MFLRIVVCMVVGCGTRGGWVGGGGVRVRGGKVMVYMTILLALTDVFCLSFSFTAHCCSDRTTGVGSPVTRRSCGSSMGCLNICSCRGYLRARVNLKLSLGNNVGMVLRVSMPSMVRGLTSRGASTNFAGTVGRTETRRRTGNNSFISLFVGTCRGDTPNRGLTRMFTARRLRNGISPRDDSTRMRGTVHSSMRSTVSGSFGIIHAHVSGFNIMRPGVRGLRNRRNHVVMRVPNVDRPRHVHGVLRNDTGLRF